MLDEIKKIVEKELGYAGRMISGSKGAYRFHNPKNVTVFNSNLIAVVGDEFKKVWHGDIDLTIDEEKLKNVAGKLKTSIYVLYESDARFDNESNPLIERAVVGFTLSDGKIHTVIHPDYYIERDNTCRLVHKEPEPPTEEEIREQKERSKKYHNEIKFDKSLKASSKELIELGKEVLKKKSLTPIDHYWAGFEKKFSKYIKSLEKDELEMGRIYIHSSDANHLEDVVTKWAKRKGYGDYQIHKIQGEMWWNLPSYFKEGTEHNDSKPGIILVSSRKKFNPDK